MMMTDAALQAVTTGKLRVISTAESLRVARAVDALLSRRSEMMMEAPAALVLGELAVRIRAEPPYLLPHVRIRPRGVLGKLIDPFSSPFPRLTPAAQEEACEEFGMKYGGVAVSPGTEE